MSTSPSVGRAHGRPTSTIEPSGQHDEGNSLVDHTVALQHYTALLRRIPEASHVERSNNQSSLSAASIGHHSTDRTLEMSLFASHGSASALSLACQATPSYAYGGVLPTAVHMQRIATFEENHKTMALMRVDGGGGAQIPREAMIRIPHIQALLVAIGGKTDDCVTANDYAVRLHAILAGQFDVHGAITTHAAIDAMSNAKIKRKLLAARSETGSDPSVTDGNGTAEPPNTEDAKRSIMKLRDHMANLQKIVDKRKSMKPKIVEFQHSCAYLKKAAADLRQSVKFQFLDIMDFQATQVKICGELIGHDAFKDVASQSGMNLSIVKKQEIENEIKKMKDTNPLRDSASCLKFTLDQFVAELQIVMETVLYQKLTKKQQKKKSKRQASGGSSKPGADDCDEEETDEEDEDDEDAEDDEDEEKGGGKKKKQPKKKKKIPPVTLTSLIETTAPLPLESPGWSTLQQYDKQGPELTLIRQSTQLATELKQVTSMVATMYLECDALRGAADGRQKEVDKLRRDLSESQKNLQYMVDKEAKGSKPVVKKAEAAAPKSKKAPPGGGKNSAASAAAGATSSPSQPSSPVGNNQRNTFDEDISSEALPGQTLPDEEGAGSPDRVEPSSPTSGSPVEASPPMEGGKKSGKKVPNAPPPKPTPKPAAKKGSPAPKGKTSGAGKGTASDVAVDTNDISTQTDAPASSSAARGAPLSPTSKAGGKASRPESSLSSASAHVADHAPSAVQVVMSSDGALVLPREALLLMQTVVTELSVTCRMHLRADDCGLDTAEGLIAEMRAVLHPTNVPVVQFTSKAGDALRSVSHVDVEAEASVGPASPVLQAATSFSLVAAWGEDVVQQVGGDANAAVDELNSTLPFVAPAAADDSSSPSGPAATSGSNFSSIRSAFVKPDNTLLKNTTDAATRPTKPPAIESTGPQILASGLNPLEAITIPAAASISRPGSQQASRSLVGGTTTAASASATPRAGAMQRPSSVASSAGDSECVRGPLMMQALGRINNRAVASFSPVLPNTAILGANVSVTLSPVAAGVVEAFNQRAAAGNNSKAIGVASSIPLGKLRSMPPKVSTSTCGDTTNLLPESNVNVAKDFVRSPLPRVVSVKEREQQADVSEELAPENDVHERQQQDHRRLKALRISKQLMVHSLPATSLRPAVVPEGPTLRAADKGMPSPVPPQLPFAPPAPHAMPARALK